MGSIRRTLNQRDLFHKKRMSSKAFSKGLYYLGWFENQNEELIARGQLPITYGGVLTKEIWNRTFVQTEVSKHPVKRRNIG